MECNEEMARDPVSGFSVFKDEAVSHDHDGTTYFFENEDNKAAFIDDPELYLSNIPG